MVLNLEFKDCAFVARQCALDAIGVLLMLEGERNFRGFDILIQIDDLAAFAARFTKQRPRDRVEQGRLARAIVPRNASQIEGTEIEVNRISIR